MTSPADRLKSARESADVSLREAAYRSHSFLSTIRFMESGRTEVTAPKAVQFGELYRVSPAWILWGDYPREAHLSWVRHEKGKLMCVRYDRYKAGRRIVTARQNRGMLQRDLAQRVHMTQPSLSGIENGRVKLMPRVCKRIASALDIDKAWLLFGVDVNKDK